MALNFNLLRNRFGNMGDGENDTLAGMQSGMLDPRKNMYGQDQTQEPEPERVIPRPGILEAANAPKLTQAPAQAQEQEEPEPSLPSVERDLFDAGLNRFGGEPEAEGDSGTGESDEEMGAGFDVDSGASQSQLSKDSGKTFADLFSQANRMEPGQAEQRYTNFLSKGAPNREDYRPGKMDRLSAILGGASEGFSRGAGAGIKTAREVLERPYDQGLKDYQTKAGTLAEAARIEGNTMARKANFARVAAQSEAAAAKAKQTETMQANLFKKWGAEEKAAAARAAQAGVHWTVDKTSGRTIGVKVDSEGKTVDTYIGPKTDETPSEQDARELKDFTDRNGITVRGQKSVAGYTSGLSLGNQKEMAEVNAGIAGVAQNKAAGIEEQHIQTRAEAQQQSKSLEESEREKAVQRRMDQLYQRYGTKVEPYFTMGKDKQNNPYPIGIKPGIDPRDPRFLEIWDAVYPDLKKP